MKQLIFPSIVAKNQKELDRELGNLKGTVKELHLDLVEKSFAHNHSLNFNFKLNSNFTYQMHLMVKEPLVWIKRLEKHKEIKLFIPQIEEMRNISRYISGCRSKHNKVAFAIKPETKLIRIKPFLKEIDLLLILSVHPGFYGKKFLPGSVLKIKEIKIINPSLKVIVDGGMNPDTIKLAKKAGGDYFVSGSYTTKAEKPKERMKLLLKALRK